jgi:hypothetical protein
MDNTSSGTIQPGDSTTSNTISTQYMKGTEIEFDQCATNNVKVTIVDPDTTDINADEHIVAQCGTNGQWINIHNRQDNCRRKCSIISDFKFPGTIYNYNGRIGTSYIKLKGDSTGNSFAYEGKISKWATVYQTNGQGYLDVFVLHCKESGLHMGLESQALGNVDSGNFEGVCHGGTRQVNNDDIFLFYKKGEVSYWAWGHDNTLRDDDRFSSDNCDIIKNPAANMRVPENISP